jgi:Ca-activated chloride channel family protein
MTFAWPAMLLAVALVPLGVLVYRWIGLRRRRRLVAHRFKVAPVAATAVTGAGGVSAGATTRAFGRPGRWRVRIPGALFVVGALILALSLARPHSDVGVPRFEGTVILAFDVSGSMAATDLAPTRMEAAKAAAKAFVERQPSSVRIGVVAFSDSGFAVQPPTNDQSEVQAAIARLGPERATSLGQGILISLQAAELALSGPDTDYYSAPVGASPEPTPEPTPVPPGTFAPATIVLLSDGENTTQPDPIEVAKLAVDRGIRIDTVGIGSPEGTELEIDGFHVHTALDEAVLRQISAMTGGTYHGAGSPADLESVYDEVETRLVVRTEPIEVTSLFVGAGVLVLLAGAASSLYWLGRLP